MAEYRFQVNLGGMIEVLSDHLYSSPDVYIRELLQNAVDAIVARKKAEGGNTEDRINVILSEKRLRFIDNGIGLSEDEIHRFLAIIGESSKKELDNDKLRSDYIGRFGIGLLSCFMVSDEISLITRSVHDDRTFVWTGKPDGTYILEECEKTHEVGTEIILNAKAGSERYFEYDTVMELLIHYGVLLPYPIFLENGEQKVRLNPVALPWQKAEVSKEELMQFGRLMFREDFLDCVVLRSEAGEADGVAYFLPYSVQASVHQQHMIYLKNMLLTEKGENILPDWAFFTRCIINAKALRPTASREGFYVDDVLEQTRKELGTCISDYLMCMARDDKQAFRRFMDIHNIAVRSMATSDEEMFDIFIDELEFYTSRGYMTGRELRMCNEPLVYANMGEYRQLSQLFVSQNRLLINAGYVFTMELLAGLADKYGLELAKVNMDEVEDMLKDVTPMEAEACVDFLSIAEQALKIFGCDVEIKQFIPSNLPAFYYIDEDAALYQQIQSAMENADDVFSGILGNFAQSVKPVKPIIYFNYRNPIVRKLAECADEGLVTDVVVILYVQTLLVGGFHLHNNELGYMNERLLVLLDRSL